MGRFLQSAATEKQNHQEITSLNPNDVTAICGSGILQSETGSENEER